MNMLQKIMVLMQLYFYYNEFYSINLIQDGAVKVFLRVVYSSF